jgi:hypothetical protein
MEIWGFYKLMNVLHQDLDFKAVSFLFNCSNQNDSNCNLSSSSEKIFKKILKTNLKTKLDFGFRGCAITVVQQCQSNLSEKVTKFFQKMKAKIIVHRLIF